ncbi:serine/threonine-protein kinase [Streptomyces liangshanensis]|uniref:non-specific serine/threonine protein kinase n=1 Tax=Streptomyces liangshanensis TaxID=2717324 RepID=A0A6G9H7E0_9ACTN|nr:serine/threonine-protein kinase [Streptomyces liangshanensis]QIQ06468.1 serine/threonine protein kinase [Streptomyces liangshanensis]
MNSGGSEGRVIDGRFELLDRLGGGGMGLVWRARDLALHREVALKEVRPPDPAMMAANPTAARVLRERVLREAQALAAIDHPGVVTIHHIVDAAEVAHPWIVMELVPGRSLQERLEQGPLTPVEAARIGRGVLSALRAAHAVGIHHRDVKPANVLLRADGRPVLTDFGIAALRESSHLTATGDLIGSPDYIAPERIRGDEGNPASDLWSLGMLLYVAVEGRHPLRRTSALATLAAVLDEEIPPPVQAGPLAPVLVALLDRNTAARPDAAALDGLLAAVERGEAAPEPEPADAVPPRYDIPTTHLRSPGPPPPYTPPPAPANTPPRVRPSRGISVAAAVAGVAATGLLVWNLAPFSGESEGKDGAGAPAADRPTTSASAPVRSSTPTPTPTPTPTASEDLLSPAAIRKAIAALDPVMGGTEVTGFSVHEQFASAEALVKGEKKLFDRYAYRDGVATREGPGQELAPGEGSVDLASFDWDKVPALIRTADTELGIDKPTSHYLIVRPVWPFADDQPVLLVYVSDSYGSAYLAADRKGKVVKMTPR